jgi:predicted nucleic acid-binding protein
MSRKSAGRGIEAGSAWPDGLGVRRIAVDTVVWIYFIEDHRTWAPLLEPLFERVDSGDITLITSALTLLEVLVVPFRAGNLDLAARYEALLMRSRGVDLAPIGHDVLRSAAQLRARFTVRAPDAIQLATALGRRCRVFLTNDRRIPAIPGLRILRLSELRGG